jgi:hypothetical protein
MTPARFAEAFAADPGTKRVLSILMSSIAIFPVLPPRRVLRALGDALLASAANCVG